MIYNINVKMIVLSTFIRFVQSNAVAKIIRSKIMLGLVVMVLLIALLVLIILSFFGYLNYRSIITRSKRLINMIVEDKMINNWLCRLPDDEYTKGLTLIQ